MHAALDTTCTEQPTLDTYAQSHGQAFLNGELLAGILNASLEMPRQTLAGGIPNGAAEAGLEAAGVSGWQASLAKSVLLPVVRPYLGDGIDNIAVEGFECKDFVMREVETEYCLPFRIGGQVTGLNVVCSGEYVLDLSWPVQPVEGLLDEQSQQLRGGFRLQLEPESSLLLTKLDLQRDEIFTAFSRCDFHLVPRVTMDFRGLRFAPDGVRPRTASELAIFRAAGVEGTPDEEVDLSSLRGDPDFEALTSRLLSAQRFLQAEALPRHVRDTSETLPRRFRDTSETLASEIPRLHSLLRTRDPLPRHTHRHVLP